MKTIKLIRLAACSAAAAASFGAFADSQNLTVTANVAAACKLTAVPAMTFTLDPGVGTAQTQTSTVQYRCTKGTNAGAFTVNGANTGSSNITLASATPLTNTDTIGVALSWVNPTAYAGVGFTAGAAKSVTITGTVAANTYDVNPDTYSFLVPISILP
jgi:spore coat protein U-like protein